MAGAVFGVCWRVSPVALPIVNDVSYSVALRIVNDVSYVRRIMTVIFRARRNIWFGDVGVSPLVAGRHLVMLEFYFSWQAQYLVMLQCHFVADATFGEAV